MDPAGDPDLETGDAKALGWIGMNFSGDFIWGP